ncbi:MAG: tRNA preQ1(34) S-adenosylmethionine ribosyltransferase-isomerase QueA [Betaproteobacteria bacterium]
MKLDDFDYALPEELIAQHPLAERGASRMMHVDGAARTVRDGWFRDLPTLLRGGDLLVFTDPRVIRARLRGRKRSGGQVEVLVERVLDAREALAQVRASKTPKAGSFLDLAGGLVVEVLGREGEFFRLRFPEGEHVLKVLERHGEVPLPPYIERAAGDSDETRYQTVYADRPGSVAAPTAGLHFSEPMFERIREAGAATAFLTLHVGAGTFQPVRAEVVSQHRMHSEWYEIPPGLVQAVQRCRDAGGRVMAVGTTSLRALEGAAAADGQLQAGSGETNLFVVPGYRFQVVDRLFTNFHLPRSTLLMLVSAFGGHGVLMDAYRHAVQERYRFFSYGDCMLIERAPS